METKISKLLDSINVLYNRKNNIIKLFGKTTDAPPKKSKDYKTIITKYDKTIHDIADINAIKYTSGLIKELVSKLENKIKYKDALGECYAHIYYDTWESVIRNIIDNYVSAAHSEINNLLAGNYYKFKSIHQKPIPYYFIQCKILSYFIQNCSIDSDMTLFRGIKDKTTKGIESKQTQFEINKYDDELYDILTKISNGNLNIYELGDIVSYYYYYVFVMTDSFTPDDDIKFDDKWYQDYENNPEKYANEFENYKKKKESMREKIKASIKPDAKSNFNGVAQRIYELKKELKNQTPYPAIKKQVSTVGNAIVFPGFTSTTLYRPRNEHIGSTYLPVDPNGKVNNCCLFKIIVPKGFPAMYISGNIYEENEMEVILPPCTKFIVKKVETNGNEITLYPVDYKQMVSSFDEFAEDMVNFLKYERCNDETTKEQIKNKYSKEYEKYKCSITYSTDI